MIAVSEAIPAEIAEIDLYEKREKIYTRKMEGFFQHIRLYTGWPLLLGYFLLPWFDWGERQAVLFDLPQRQFHILNVTFWPQDLTLLAWLLIISALLLFAVTNLAGRVWCGYTCPQTVWTSIFMWAEQFAEGTRNQRIKLDAAPWSVGKLYRKTLKHGMWLGFAFLTGFTFVGYFTPIRELALSFIHFSVNGMALFWVAFFTFATYGNAGWLREQVCLYMCPYARFQSAMFDSDTLIISYDSKRGEPRGSRKRGLPDQERELGDCINCQLCVQVCPTGIDIRDGLQYQCIGCALCIDACDSIMDKMQYPRGLISYTTENTLAGKSSKIMRPRLIGYIVAIAIMCMAFAFKVVTRDIIELSVLRDRQALFYFNEVGQVENLYTIKLANKSQREQAYALSIDSALPLALASDPTVRISSGEVVEFPVKLYLRDSAASSPDTDLPSVAVTFTATNQADMDESISVDSRFFVPAN
ncbi:MAG: cytochrome c oxidase accessory protein CcoG [Pseudomonadales bacterium]